MTPRPLLIPLALIAFGTTAAADTVRFDFSGLVETASRTIGVPGAIDSGASGATAYTATALFDTDVTPGVDIFGRRNFSDALIGFEATFGTLGTVTLNRTATASQNPTGGTLSGFFGYQGDPINPRVDALDGSVNGFEALLGSFRLSAFPGEQDFFADADDLLSGVGNLLTFERTSTDSFELSFLPGPGGFFLPFIVADIGEGTFTRVPDAVDPGLPTTPTNPPLPAPIPLPAGAPLLLGAFALLGLGARRRG